MKRTRIGLFERTSLGASVWVRPLGGAVTRVRLSAALPEIHLANPLLVSFLSEMLQRGSKKYSKEKYEEALASRGFELHLSAEGGYLHVSAAARTAALNDLLLILGDTLRHPLFLSTEIVKLKKEVIQVIHESKQDTRYLASSLFSRLLYEKGDPRYVASLAEQKPLLNAVSKGTLKRAHDALRAAKWSVSVSGPRTSYDAVSALMQNVAIAKKASEVAFFSHARARGRAVSTCEYVSDKQNVELFIGNTIPLLPGTPTFTAFSFGIDVLGKRGGFAGRLMSTVREKEGLTYGIYAWLGGAHATYPGHFVIGTFFTPKDLPQGITSTFREVTLIKEKGVSDEEVRRFKTLLLNQYVLSFEAEETTLNAYHGALLSGFPPSYVDEYPERIADVTAKTVTDALREHLNVEDLLLAGSGSIKKFPHAPSASLSKS